MDAFGRSDKKKEREKKGQYSSLNVETAALVYLLTELIERRVIFEALFASGF